MKIILLLMEGGGNTVNYTDVLFCLNYRGEDQSRGVMYVKNGSKDFILFFFDFIIHEIIFLL